jgi:micrococcal nuclease
MNKLLTIFTCLLFSISVFSGNFVSGKAIKVWDGDTYDLLLDNKTRMRIRMDGIDAPEKGMPYSRVSKKYLGQLLLGKHLKIEEMKKDGFNRIVAKTFLPDGREAGQEMVRAGFAWHYTKYNSEKVLQQLEDNAHKNKIGLWADKHPLAPWDVRKMHRKGISTKKMYTSSVK